MDDLQFDKAEYGGAAGDAADGVRPCQNALAGEYFHVNEQPFCASCKAEVERVLGGSPGPAGFVKAALGGVAGGIAGALLYYLVLALTGYEIGIIAIAVGFLVGKGVRWGTGNRGGRLYPGPGGRTDLRRDRVHLRARRRPGAQRGGHDAAVRVRPRRNCRRSGLHAGGRPGGDPGRHPRDRRVPRR